MRVKVVAVLAPLSLLAGCGGAHHRLTVARAVHVAPRGRIEVEGYASRRGNRIWLCSRIVDASFEHPCGPPSLRVVGTTWRRLTGKPETAFVLGTTTPKALQKAFARSSESTGSKVVATGVIRDGVLFAAP